MSKVFIEEESLTAIGNAIREKTGDTAPLSVPTGMVNAIGSITTGGSSGGGDVSINGAELKEVKALEGNFPANTMCSVKKPTAHFTNKLMTVGFSNNGYSPIKCVYLTYTENRLWRYDFYLVLSNGYGGSDGDYRYTGYGYAGIMSIKRETGATVDNMTGFDDAVFKSKQAVVTFSTSTGCSCIPVQTKRISDSRVYVVWKCISGSTYKYYEQLLDVSIANGNVTVVKENIINGSSSYNCYCIIDEEADLIIRRTTNYQITTSKLSTLSDPVGSLNTSLLTRGYGDDGVKLCTNRYVIVNCRNSTSLNVILFDSNSSAYIKTKTITIPQSYQRVQVQRLDDTHIAVFCRNSYQPFLTYSSTDTSLKDVKMYVMEITDNEIKEIDLAPELAWAYDYSIIYSKKLDENRYLFASAYRASVFDIDFATGSYTLVNQQYFQKALTTSKSVNMFLELNDNCVLIASEYYITTLSFSKDGRLYYNGCDGTNDIYNKLKIGSSTTLRNSPIKCLDLMAVASQRQYNTLRYEDAVLDYSYNGKDMIMIGAGLPNYTSDPDYRGYLGVISVDTEEGLVPLGKGLETAITIEAINEGNTGQAYVI